MELQVKNISKSYGDKRVLRAVSFDLTPGVYGLLGANGSGKTTLFRILCALMKPDEGQVVFKGRNILEQAEAYRMVLGFLPQEFRYYPDFTVKNFLLYIAALKGLKRKPAAKRCDDLLQLVGLADLKGKKIRKLSGGMKQRLGIAQSLLNDPQLLILDEPTVGLDPKERVKFRKLLSKISKDKIIILSTHIVSDVEDLADEIFILKEGRLLERGSAAELTAGISRQVWECTVSEAEADRLEEVFVVTNRRHEAGTVLLRIVSAEQPIASARLVSPSLEDLYLYYFREEA